MSDESMLIFGGSGSLRLTHIVCSELSVEPARGEVLRFSEGNLFVRVLQNVRGRRVYVLQATAFPANDNFVELLFWIDALKRASADSVTAVIPYFSYAKGDKKDEPRVSIRARVCADAIESAGADRIITMDLHTSQVQGFFKKPVDDLYARWAAGRGVREGGAGVEEDAETPGSLRAEALPTRQVDGEKKRQSAKKFPEGLILPSSRRVS